MKIYDDRCSAELSAQTVTHGSWSAEARRFYPALVSEDLSLSLIVGKLNDYDEQRGAYSVDSVPDCLKLLREWEEGAEEETDRILSVSVDYHGGSMIDLDSWKKRRFVSWDYIRRFPGNVEAAIFSTGEEVSLSLTGDDVSPWVSVEIDELVDSGSLSAHTTDAELAELTARICSEYIRADVSDEDAPNHDLATLPVDMIYDLYDRLNLAGTVSFDLENKRDELKAAKSALSLTDNRR